jgi:hypothetical protein
MDHERLIFAIYTTLFVSVWWLLWDWESATGWFLASLLVALALTVDYFLTEAPAGKSHPASRWKSLRKIKFWFEQLH